METSSLLDEEERAGVSQTLRVPLVKEDLAVETREVVTGRVTVRTVVDEEAVELSSETTRGAVDVVRLPMNVVVEVAPAIRVDGDTTIIPIVEERLVVVKQLVLTEEVHVRLVRTTTPVTIAASRRVMRPIIERSPTEPPVQPERNIHD